MDFKTIMVHLEPGRDNSSLLKITADLAKRLNAAVIGIAACQPVQIAYGDGFLAGEILAQDRQEIEGELHDTERQFRAALAGQATSLGWRSTVTMLPLADYIAHEARAADLIVTGPDRGGAMLDNTRRVNIASLVMQAGRPVLVVPSVRTEMKLRHALIGWKGNRESRRAIADALPLLRLALKVTVVKIAPDAELSRAKGHLVDVVNWLKSHGVAAEPLAAVGIGEESRRIADLAHELAADLVVAGAYGHSRAMEWMLGGVTEDFLLHPDRCVLMSH